MHDDLRPERQRPRGLHVHPSERQIGALTRRALGGSLEDELDRAATWHPCMATKLDHPWMIASTAMDVSRRRHELRDAAWLSLVPLGIALVLGLLLTPRRPPPEGVPVPIADPAAMARVVRADHELADLARREPLPGAVRSLGSAIRDFHALEAADADARALGQARRAIDLALVEALALGHDALLRLRAVQLEGFVDEVHRFAATGEQSAELKALAGGFVRSITSEGWCEGHTLTPDTPVLRAMFKQMWNALLGLDRGGAPAAGATPSASDMALTIDEERTLYAFYLSHAHPSRATREAIASARRTAGDARACRALRETERAAVGTWRLDHIARISALDPTYPADYARGVARFDRGEYRASADAFRRWIDDHPEGPLALRAQNYLRAAADADRLE